MCVYISAICDESPVFLDSVRQYAVHVYACYVWRIYTHIHTYIHTYQHSYAHLRTHACMHACIHTFSPHTFRLCVRVLLRAASVGFALRCITCMQCARDTYIYLHIHIHTHTYTYTHTHTHTHTYIWVRMCPRAPCLLFFVCCAFTFEMRCNFTCRMCV